MNFSLQNVNSVEDVILKKDAVELAILVVICEEFLIFLDPDNRCFALPRKIGKYLLIGNASHSRLSSIGTAMRTSDLVYSIMVYLTLKSPN